MLLLRRQPGQRRQQIGGQRNAKQPLRQLHQPHRVVERGHNGRLEPERKTLRDQHVDLEGGHPNRARQHFARHLADGRVAPGRNPPVAIPLAHQARPLEKSLGQPGQQHPDRQPEYLLLQAQPQPRRQQQHAADHDHIEHHRPQRRHEKMPARIGHADKHRRQAYQQHVGKHQPQQPQHELRLHRQRPPRQRQRNPQHHQPRHRRRRGDQPGDHRVGRPPHLRFPLLQLLLLEERNKRRRQRPLAQQPPEQVGHLKGQGERAGHPGVAHEPRIDHLAHHAQHPAGQRRRGHRAGGFQHLGHRSRRLTADGGRLKAKLGPGNAKSGTRMGPAPPRQPARTDPQTAGKTCRPQPRAAPA